MIRYRAWDMVHKRWGKPGLRCDNQSGCWRARLVLHWNFDSGILELYPNDWAWLPSTGFADRDRVEIFRGDLVTFAGRVATVTWNPDEGWHELAFHDRDGRFQRIHLNLGLSSSVSVVGNSHEGKNFSPVGAVR